MARQDPTDRVEAYYRRVADELVEQIEGGVAPWTQAWEPGARGLPSNVKTGKPYRGGNSVWLASTAERRGYGDERWGTFKQVQQMDAHVRRGEKGCSILFWQFEERKLARGADGVPVRDGEGQPVYDTRPLQHPRVFQYTVFNAEQCEGLPGREGPGAEGWDNHAEAERVLKRSGAQIVHQGDTRAYYDLRRDRVMLPGRACFPSAPAYYQTVLHELGHWTGHPDRLNRETLTRGVEDGFGSRAYAREELRAEISSLMVGDRLKIGHDPSRHAAYVGSWIQALKDDPREIYRASREAQQMSDYLLERGRVQEQQAAKPRSEQPRIHQAQAWSLPAGGGGGSYPGAGMAARGRQALEQSRTQDARER